MTTDHNTDHNTAAAHRERELLDKGFQLGRDSLVALLPQNWMLALRTGPDKYGLGEYTVQIDGLAVCVIPSRDGTGYADPEAELAAWRALVACVRRIMARPRPATADGVIPLPSTDAEFPRQLVTATWITDQGEEVVLRHPRRTSRQLRAFGRRPTALALLVPAAAHRIGAWALAAGTSTAGAVAIVATAGTVIAAGGTPGIGGDVTSLHPRTRQPAGITIRYAAPAPPRVDREDSDTPSPHPTHHTPMSPVATPTAHPDQLPTLPAVTPTPIPTIVPSVPASVTPPPVPQPLSTP